MNDVSGTYFTIDHFIISNSLNTCVNNYCTVNDIDNMSDHLPLGMYINLPVNIMFLMTLNILCLNPSGPLQMN